MKSLKNKYVLAGAAASAVGMMSLVSGADAAFTVAIASSTNVGTNTIYRISAVDDGSTGITGTGTQLVGENISINTTGVNGTTSSTGIQFYHNDIDGDGYADADLFGATATGGSISLTTETVGTVVRIGTVANQLLPSVYATAASTSQLVYKTGTNSSGLASTSNYKPGALDPAFANTNALHQLNLQSATSAPVTDTTAVIFAVVVVPTGSTATLSGTLGGNVGNAFTLTPLVLGGSTGPSHGIISLTAGTTAPTTYGSSDGSIAVTGKGNGSYNVTTASNFSTATTGYVSVTGFNPSTDTEIYALKLSTNGTAITSSDTRLSTIVQDINGGGTTGNLASSGVTASLVTGVFTSLFPGYDILLTSTAATPATGGAAEFGFDFSAAGDSDTSIPNITVTGVAAVPEPATAAGVMLGAAGLLLGRRKNKVLVT